MRRAYAPSAYQRTIPFSDEPLAHRSLRKPPFFRPETAVRTYKGIPPREAFGLASELLALGHTESDIDAKLVEKTQLERYRIEKLLKRMETGMAVSQEQCENAMRVLMALHESRPQKPGLTNMELTWWLHELNISQLLGIPVSQADEICIKIQRRLIGKFRGHMPETFERLKRT